MMIFCDDRRISLPCNPDRNLGPCFHLRFSPQFRSRTTLVCEEPVLAQALPFYREHKIRPQALTDAARIEVGVVVPTVQLEECSHDCQTRDSNTLTGWHRKGFELFWR